MKKFIALLLCILMLFNFSACGKNIGEAGNGGTLDLDYIGEDSGEEESEDDGELGWLEWLKNALAADRTTNAQKQAQQEQESDRSAADEEPSTIQEYYQQGTEKHDEEQNSDSSQSTASQPQAESGGSQSQNAKEETVSSAASSSIAPQEENKPTGDTVTILINCQTAVNNGMHLESKWAGIVPASGVILPETTVEIEEGDTVLDVLLYVCEKYKIHMEFSGGTGSGAYVEGINNLYEFDGGRWSGWMYCVNGWYPNYGCGVYFVKAGDSIEWNYTCDLGCDLENGDPNGYGQEWKDTHD